MSPHERKSLTRDEISLLLYLDTCAVDHGGMLDQRKMNAADRDTLARWAAEKYVETGRRCFDDGGGNWVHLPPETMADAHLARAARAEAAWQTRAWRTTAEARG